MMKVKVKTPKHSFTIPVPYTFLRMGSGILTSRIAHRLMIKWLHLDSGQPPHLKSSNELLVSILQDRSMLLELKKIIKDIQSCRGTVLVDVHTHDGTIVMVTL